MDWKKTWVKVAGEARKRGAQVVEVLKETAFELEWDARDAAKTGFGVPKLLSSAASLGVATVAAAGAASVAFDFTGKIWGKKECSTCNGWEGMRCRICTGTGKVRYNINESTLTEAERSSSQSIAAAALEGRAEIEYIARTNKLDLPFPFIDCPECDGSGVMKCITCTGNAWVPKFTIAKTMGAPWLAWDAYRKIKPPDEEPSKVIADPDMAAFQMFRKDELENDIEYSEETKQAAMAKYEDDREYDLVKQHVERRDPGWETLQKVLFLKDPERAANDPVIVTNPRYYKAKVKILKEVEELPVPPRPADWLANQVEKPLKESDWSKEDLKDPRKRSAMKALLQGQESFYNKLLDRTWESHWREQKFEELKKEMIDSYEREKDTPQHAAETAATQNIADVGPSPSRSTTKKAKPAGKQADAKKRPEDDRKRRERQERSERMARQAGEREAALSKAKAARESRDKQ
ncbi:unnamed protein product [Calypogeia fissa]